MGLFLTRKDIVSALWIVVVMSRDNKTYPKYMDLFFSCFIMPLKNFLIIVTLLANKLIPDETGRRKQGMFYVQWP